jgi:hypothetical protein
MPRTPRFPGLLAIYPHLTGRDLTLLGRLYDHQVLTTDQITRLLFGNERTCQVRLKQLEKLGLLTHFRFHRTGGGSYRFRWLLDHAGQRFAASRRSEPEPTARASAVRITSLSASPRLSHLLVVNEFFVRLAAHARTHPHTCLDRWWSEAHTTKQFHKILLQPDGHGLWTRYGHTVGFWLEADTGSEPLTRVVSKLDTYRKVAASGGPRYPVLFWLSSPTREEHLHRLLRQQRGGVATATATQDSDPAEAVWLPSDGHQRVRLIELPSSHGIDNGDNPNFCDGVLDLDAVDEAV